MSAKCVKLFGVALLLLLPCLASAQDPDRFKSIMEGQGYLVQEGSLETVPIIQLCCAGLVPSCFGNNATLPYTAYVLPDGPGQTAPNSFRYTWRLRQDEAVVLTNNTPPACAYFSYQTFAQNRLTEDGARVRVYANLGDTINYQTIKTAGSPAPGKGNPYDQLTVIITTAHRDTEAQVRQALIAAGYPEAVINTEAIPSSLARLGLQYAADEFSFLNRMANWVDSQAGQAYLDKPLGASGRIFRVSPAAEKSADPLQPPAFRVRGVGTTEFDLLSALADLRRAILEAHGRVNAQDFVSYQWFPDGNDCLQRETECMGATRDALYLRTDNFLLGAQDYIIVYGVNHQAAGKATYSNFGIYGSKLTQGAGGGNSAQMEGSAQVYLPGHPLANLLYAWKLARSCGKDEKYCHEVSTNCSDPGVALDEPAFMGFRAYCEPGSNVGPALGEMVYDRVIRYPGAR